MEFTSQLSTASEPNKIASDLTVGGNGPVDVGFLFFSGLNTRVMTEAVSLIKNRLSLRCLIGCSCAGVIATHSEIEYRPATTLILGKLPGVQLHPFDLNQIQLERLRGPEDWYHFFEIFPTEKPNFIILPDPFSIDMNYFLRELNQAYPGCPVMGGLASGASRPQENILFINQEHYSQGAVGVAMVGNVEIQTIVSQGCRPIGESYIVTKGEGNIIHQLAGRPFLHVLQEILQKIPARDKLLAQEAIFVGIAMDEYRHQFKRGDFLIRGLIGIDQTTGAGAIGDYVHTGQTIQFHVRDAESATEDLNILLQGEQRRGPFQKPKGALIFSCNGRGEYLFREKDHDIRIIQKYIGPVPAAGFFCAGEIGPVGGNNFLHGFTSSIAIFYPTQKFGFSPGDPAKMTPA